MSKRRRGSDCEQESDFVEIHVCDFGVKENINQEVERLKLLRQCTIRSTNVFGTEKKGLVHGTTNSSSTVQMR